MPVTLDRGEAERLVHAYSDLILRLSYTYLKSTDDAQDICQTVFLKLLQKPQAFSSPEHEKAWIIRTAVNLCKLRQPIQQCSGRACLYRLWQQRPHFPALQPGVYHQRNAPQMLAAHGR